MRPIRGAAHLLQHPVDIGLDESPGPHVLGLFLAPDDLGLLEAVQLIEQGLGRERVELFEAQQVDIVDAALFAVLEQVIVDLARTKDNAADVGVRHQPDGGLGHARRLGIVPEEAMEGGLRSEFGQGRNRLLVAQQRLGRHQHQRLAEVAGHLAAQHVEIVGGRRAVGDLHVVFGAELQIALEPGRGMVGALAFVAVRQEHHQPRHAEPLAFARGDELVHHHLGAVGEVAELAFPQRQRLGLGQRVAVFEAEHGLFRQHGVDDFVARLLVSDVVERRIGLFGHLVVKHRVALAEGAAFDVLAGKAHRIALGDEGAERQRLGGRPINAFARFEGGEAVVEEAADGLVDVEARRHGA